MATGWQIDVEKRLAAVEQQCAELKMIILDPEEGIMSKLDTITVFVSGANTIFGLARKHWKRVFIFGAGFMTAAGVGNPKVNAFIISFLGG